MSGSEGVYAKAGALERAMAHKNPEGRQWLRGGHVEIQQARDRQIDMGHLGQRHPLVETHQAGELRFR